MGRIEYISGCVAAAHGARLADVDVICSYPIRPYTGIMSELARMVANGDLDAEFVHGEGEHAQLSVVYGASAAGGRAYTGSSGVGVTYAMEVYSPSPVKDFLCRWLSLTVLWTRRVTSVPSIWMLCPFVTKASFKAGLQHLRKFWTTLWHSIALVKTREFFFPRQLARTGILCIPYPELC